MIARTSRDPVAFELLRHATASIVDEMALNVVRTAYSHLLRDVLDFATALCDRQGQLVAQGPSLPLHMGSMPDALSRVLQQFDSDIFPGDVFILNDPYDGGMHLPDLFVIKPVFIGERLLAFSAITAHHADLGGRAPGSMAYDSTDVYQEGLRIPVLKLFDRGRPNKTLFRLLEWNTRLPQTVLGDLRSQLAACHIGEVRFNELVAKHGMSEMERYFEDALEYSEALTRAEVERIANGRYEYEDHMDGDGLDPEPIRIRVRLTVHDDSIDADFSGTSGQVRGAINPTFSYTKSTVYATLRCVMDGAIPTNSGYFRPIRIHAPLGSILNPKPPAACAMRGQTAYRLADVLFGALAKALPDRVFAAGEGGTSNIRISGTDRERGTFTYTDTIQGTWGARPSKDGVDGAGNIVSNLSNAPAEVIEAGYPIRVRRYGLVTDSGGAGRFRGGMSVLRELEFLGDDAELQVRADRQAFRPFGLAGGMSGRPAEHVLSSRDEVRDLPLKTTVRMRRGDAVRHIQASGGGYGAPWERDPTLVLDDVTEEKVSIDAAARMYGVVINPICDEVDVEETGRLRKSKKESSTPAGSFE